MASRATIGSGVFVQGSRMEWETVGDGIERIILGYDEGLMLVRVRFQEGSVGATHRHHHRQVSYVESGSFEVHIDGVKQVLVAGDSFFVPPDIDHGAVALEGGVLLDVFAPVRGDFLD